MKPMIDFSSVKTVSPIQRTEERSDGFRLGFTLLVGAGARRGRVEIIRLLLRRMIAHGFSFDAGAYEITLNPINRAEFKELRR